MDNFVNRFAESKFMKVLEGVSTKLSSSPAFSSISAGMASTMSLIMIGAIVQIILALGTTFFGLDPNGQAYGIVYGIYQLTMGCMALYMAFSLAYTYANKLKMNGVQAGFTSMVCYLLVSAPIQNVTADGSTYFNAISIDALGSTGLFVALILALLSVRISKFAIDHNWVIKMPDVVPEGILASFNNIIPAGINIILFYGIATVLNILTNGAITLPSLVMYVLSIPLSALTSPIGVMILIMLCNLFWFFGIHGTSVIFAAIMVPFIQAYMTNAELAAAGQPLVFSALFLWSANALIGGTGNTLPLVIMGLRSKSETIKNVSKAALPAGLFNINEPAIFGYPIMYNPTLLIPFMLCPLVVSIFMYIACVTGLIALPQVLLMTTLPIFMQEFMMTFSWRNVVFTILMFPVCYLIYYPFYKVYEKQMVEQEEAAKKDQLTEE